MNEDLHGSGYFPTYLTGAEYIPQHQVPRWIMDKANWDQFTEITEQIAGIPDTYQLTEDIRGDFCAQFCACYSSLLSLSISSLPQYLCYQSVGTATGPTALCGIRTTPRIEILSPEIQPSDPLVE